MQLILKSKIFLNTILILLLLFIVLSMSLIQKVNNQLHKEYAPSIEATREIKLLTAISHLWFEEIISGDTTVNFEGVITRVELAQWYLNSILEGGVTDKISILPIRDTIIRDEIILAKKNLQDFKEITIERWNYKNLSGIGSDIDQSYDKVFNLIQQNISDIHNNIQNYKIEKEKKLNQLQNFLILSVLLLLIAMVIKISKNELALKKEQLRFKRKTDSYLALINKYIKQSASLQKAYEKIETNEKYLISVFGSAPIGIGVVKNRIISFVNERFCKITGYAEMELINNSAEMVYPDKDEYERVEKYKYEQIKKYGTGTIETIFKKKDGKLINVILSSTPININDLSKGLTFSALDITKRINTENKLKESEEKFKAFFKSNKAVMLQLNTTSQKIVSANNAAINFYQYPKKEIIGHSVNKLNALPEKEINRRMQMALKEKSNHFILKHKLASGDLRDVEVYASPIRIREEDIILLIVHDITMRTMAEKHLNESKKTQDKILDAFDDDTYLCSADNEILYLNPAMRNRIGYDAVGEKCHKAIYNSEKVCSWCYFEDLKMQKKDKVVIEVEKNNKYYIVTSVLLKDDSKLTVYHDITTRKLAEIELSKSEAKFRLLFNTANDPIFLVNISNKFIEINDEAVIQYGYSKEEFLTMNPDQLSNPGLETKFIKEIEELSKSKRKLLIQKHIKADGTIFPAEISTRMITYNDETVFLVIVHNISEREQQQQKVYNAAIQAEEKERSRVSRDIHDGVSPMLSALKIYIQSLKKHKKKVIVDEIHNRVELTLDETIETISEISNNLSPHILRNFGLAKAIKSFANKFKNIRNIEIILKADNIDGLESDIEISLYRVTTELINNTFKHSTANKITININKGAYIDYIYTDNGQGFDLEKISGKGMGIYNLSNRIKSLRGNINFTNNNGTEVVIRIPLN